MLSPAHHRHHLNITTIITDPSLSPWQGSRASVRGCTQQRPPAPREDPLVPRLTHAHTHAPRQSQHGCCILTPDPSRASLLDCNRVRHRTVWNATPLERPCSSGLGPLVNGDTRSPRLCGLRIISSGLAEGPVRSSAKGGDGHRASDSPSGPGDAASTAAVLGGHFPLATLPPREQFLGEGERPRYRRQQGGSVVQHPHRPGNPSL